MARLSTSLLLFGLLSSSLVAASPYDQAEQNRNANCDNGCFFSSFPGGSCTNDAACMCTQQKYREAYFCCMAEKCAASVLPDSIQRQTAECEARNMPFTFDEEKACGIKPVTTSSAVSEPATSTTTGDSIEASATSGPTSVVSAPDTTTEASIPVKSLDTTTKGSTPSTTTKASTPDTTTEATSTGTPETSSTGTSTPTTNSASQARVVLNGIAILIAASGILLW